MIDEDYAPSGYIAVPKEIPRTCAGCHLHYPNQCGWDGMPSCFGKDRPDGQDVVFKVRHTPITAERK